MSLRANIQKRQKASSQKLLIKSPKISWTKILFKSQLNLLESVNINLDIRE